MTPDFMGEVVALVVAAAVIAYVCFRFRIPPIVGFLIAGVIIGPHALGLVRHTELIDALAEVGVILLLFTLGIEFNFERLSRIKRAIFAGGSLQVGLAIALTTGLLVAADTAWRPAVFTGILVALSSTAMVLRVMDEGGTTSAKGQLALGILIFQDLALVVLIVLVPFLGGSEFAPGRLALNLMVAVCIVVVVVTAARRVMPGILERVARTCSQETFLLTVIAICVGTAWITSLAGVSLSLGAFLAGLVVSESRFSHQAFAEIMPLQMIFAAAFFVSVGLLLDLRFVASNFLPVIGLVILVIAVKVITTGAAALLLRYPLPAAAGASLLLAQIGEFSFVLATAGGAAGVYPMGLRVAGRQWFIATAVILMALTPLLAKMGAMIETLLSRDKRRDELTSNEAVVVAPALSLENHVIVAGYGSAARHLTRVLRDSGIPFVILTLSPTGATEAEGEGFRVILGDYSHQHILGLGGIDRAKMLVIPDDTLDMARRVTAITRSLNPTLHIVVRARWMSEVDPLMADGADQVLAEEMEIAIGLFSRVLSEYRVPPGEIEDHITTVRSGGYAALREGIADMPLVVCENLDESCFDTRTFTIRAGARADGMTLVNLRSATALTIASVERNGETLPLDDNLVVRAGDRVAARAAANVFANAGEYLRTAGAEPRIIALSAKQLGSGCTHVKSVQREITSAATACEDCVATGDTWVHLRICMTCGGVRCCDSSKNRHATRHFEASQHPVIRSFERGEEWAWCYPERLML